MEGEEAEGLGGVEEVGGFAVDLGGGEEEGGGGAMVWEWFEGFRVVLGEDEAVDSVADFGGEREEGKWGWWWMMELGYRQSLEGFFDAFGFGWEFGGFGPRDWEGFHKTVVPDGGGAHASGCGSKG